MVFGVVFVLLTGIIGLGVTRMVRESPKTSSNLRFLGEAPALAVALCDTTHNIAFGESTQWSQDENYQFSYFADRRYHTTMSEHEWIVVSAVILRAMRCED